MITDADSEFHPRDPEDRTWTETMFLPFVVPEAGIFGNVYVLARPNVGIATSSILVGQGFCTQPYEIDFTDPQVHLPCPDSFSKFTLANGLSVHAPTPREYDLSYRNALGACSFDLSFRDCTSRSIRAIRTRIRCWEPTAPTPTPDTATNGRMGISRSRATSPVSSSCADNGIGSTATTEWTTVGGRGPRPAPGPSPGCR